MKRRVRLALLLFVACCRGAESNAPLVGSGGAAGGSAGASGADTGGSLAEAGMAGDIGGGARTTPNVLVFSRTSQYRHLSIAPASSALAALAAARGWLLTATELPSTFSDAALEPFNVLLFLNTSGEVLDEAQQAAMERFIQRGNGYVGVHAAADTEYDWAWYGGLVGARFRAHPAIQRATIEVEDSQHPATALLPVPWSRTDEWYAFQTNPRANVRVLLRLDEASYAPGDAGMGPDHPLAWCHDYGGGRAFYTALGHTDEAYAEPALLAHLAGAIEWAAGTAP